MTGYKRENSSDPWNEIWPWQQEGEAQLLSLIPMVATRLQGFKATDQVIAETLWDLAKRELHKRHGQPSMVCCGTMCQRSSPLLFLWLFLLLFLLLFLSLSSPLLLADLFRHDNPWLPCTKVCFSSRHCHCLYGVANSPRLGPRQVLTMANVFVKAIFSGTDLKGLLVVKKSSENHRTIYKIIQVYKY